MKKLTLCILVVALFFSFIISFSLFGCSSTEKEKVYAIGDTGPAGGIIFYINPNYPSDDWHYLEAAPSDQSSSIMWFSDIMYTSENYIATGAKSTAIGTGKSNTQIIVNIQGEGIYAVQLCNDLKLGGYDDWFLPSRDELNLLYENLHLKGLGGFNQGDGEEYYWSSSESADDDEVLYAWQQSFKDSEQEEDNKWYEYRVRAIRSF